MKKYWKVLSCFLAIILLMMDIPYQTRTITGVLIPPIHFNGGSSRLMLNGVIVLILIIILAIELQKKTKRFDALFIFILLYFFIVPVVFGKLAETSNSIIYRFQDGVDSVRITEQNVFVSNELDELFLNMTIKYNAYNIDNRKTSFYLEIPDELQAYFGEEDLLITPIVHTSDSSEWTLRERICLPQDGVIVDLSLEQIAYSFRKYNVVVKDDETERLWIVIE